MPADGAYVPAFVGIHVSRTQANPSSAATVVEKTIGAGKKYVQLTAPLAT
jgi:hypothetical protein